MEDKRYLLSSLPKVDVIISDDKIKKLNASRNIVVEAAREIIGEYRDAILKGSINQYSYNDIIEKIVTSINNKDSAHLKKVINATGTVLHTNLGRAALSSSAVDAVIKVSNSYSNLEFDLEEGKRGTRYSHVEDILCKITGCEAAMVVNNNAAAVMLALSTLCRGKEAIVSRGQLVEIGGSFRVPAVMELSGAKLIEVGTTNRTHVYDYENAINENTGVILKVHQSNYKIMGFTEEVSIEDLVSLCKKNNLPIIEDIGSGTFVDLSKYGLTYEPTVQNSIKKGIDIVTFSGDKMLGGPQAGIIVGKREYIDLMKKNQLTRALRVDKMTLAALEVTLKSYVDESTAINEIPVLKMLTRNIAEIKKEAQRLARMIKSRIGDRGRIEVMSDYSQVGGGSMPLENIPTYVVALNPLRKSLQGLENKLRFEEVPIITRIYKDRMLFDVRTLFDKDYSVIAKTLDRLL